MLTIRLQRAGKRNRPEFRIVLAEKEASAAKKFAEILGSYNPRTKAFTIKEDRVKYWMSQHVTLSPTVHNLFVTQKLLEAAKVKAFSIPAKPEEPAAPPAATPAAPTAAEDSAPVEATEPEAAAEVVPVSEPVASAAPESETKPEPATETPA
jgi:small subunit ribosomal protein S16